MSVRLSRTLAVLLALVTVLAVQPVRELLELRAFYLELAMRIRSDNPTFLVGWFQPNWSVTLYWAALTLLGGVLAALLLGRRHRAAGAIGVALAATAASIPVSPLSFDRNWTFRGPRELAAVAVWPIDLAIACWATSALLALATAVALWRHPATAGTRPGA